MHGIFYIPGTKKPAPGRFIKQVHIGVNKYYLERAYRVTNPAIRNIEAMIMVACTLSFCNSVLIFFMHKSFKFQKKGLGYSIRIPGFRNNISFVIFTKGWIVRECKTNELLYPGKSSAIFFHRFFKNAYNLLTPERQRNFTCRAKAGNMGGYKVHWSNFFQEAG